MICVSRRVSFFETRDKQQNKATEQNFSRMCLKKSTSRFSNSKTVNHRVDIFLLLDVLEKRPTHTLNVSDSFCAQFLAFNCLLIPLFLAVFIIEQVKNT